MRQQRGRQNLLPVFGTPANSGATEGEAPGAAAASQAPPSSAAATRRSAAPASAGELTPVAVLSLYQHAYLDKYGVFGAKAYARDWFKTLDWDRVQNRAAAGAF
jgi:Fe-Mn family superoxide dismutase